MMWVLDLRRELRVRSTEDVEKLDVQVSRPLAPKAGFHTRCWLRWIMVGGSPASTDSVPNSGLHEYRSSNEVGRLPSCEAIGQMIEADKGIPIAYDIA